MAASPSAARSARCGFPSRPTPDGSPVATAIADFLRVRPFRPGWHERVVSTRANGQLAFGHYARKEDRFVPHALSVLSLRGHEIADFTVFLTPEPFARFRLPQTVE